MNAYLIPVFIGLILSIVGAGLLIRRANQLNDFYRTVKHGDINAALQGKAPFIKDNSLRVVLPVIRDWFGEDVGKAVGIDIYVQPALEGMEEPIKVRRIDTFPNGTSFYLLKDKHGNLRYLPTAFWTSTI